MSIRDMSVSGYSYQAENLCPDCVLAPERIGHVFSVEAVLDVVARFMAINRDDESSFDSGTFPKRIFEPTAGERCGRCGVTL